MADIVPPSDMYAVRSGSAGKGVVTLRDISPGRPLFDTAEKKFASRACTTGPFVSVILRPYRREVCAQCFAYDRGRAWPIRDHLTTLGVVFCSATCQNTWETSILSHSRGLPLEQSLDYQARAATEAFIRKHAKSQKNTNHQSCRATKDASSHRNETSRRGDHEDPDACIKPHCHLPTPSQIKDAWRKVDFTDAGLVRAARTSNHPTKRDQKALQKALQGMPGATCAASPPDADVLGYLLSGVLSAYHTSKSCATPNASLDQPDITQVPSEILSLVSDPQPYPSMTSLHAHVAAYTSLIAILPLELVPFTTTKLCNELISRASWNAFGLRPYIEGLNSESLDSAESGTIDSGELLGWGVWPSASFFNHSCTPNVRKARRGRQWEFSISCCAAVSAGDELCISYLGGIEREMSVKERRTRLWEGWGFWCECTKCVEESIRS